MSHLGDAEMSRRWAVAVGDADGDAVEVTLEAEDDRWVAARMDTCFHARQQAQTTAWQPLPQCGRLCLSAFSKTRAGSSP